MASGASASPGWSGWRSDRAGATMAGGDDVVLDHGVRLRFGADDTLIVTGTLSLSFARRIRVLCKQAHVE